jgi:D-glycero-alpha-D-manno-heptose-7-phosphate kinase
LHYIKKSGYQILDIVQSGEIDDLGLMFRDHWEMKKKLSSGVTNDQINSIYKTALDNGALGGKISGAGGGGFFTFYCNKNHDTLRSAMASKGLIELDYSFVQKLFQITDEKNNYTWLIRRVGELFIFKII